jgi:serine/threonine-protein kinase
VLVAQLRKALGGGKAAIETVHRRGYRFVATDLVLLASAEPAERRPKALAVLPLRPLRATEEDVAIGFGLADAVITQLARSGFEVRSTRAVARYVQTDVSAQVIARDLGVDGVIEGSLRRSGGRIRVTVQLVVPKTGRTLWADTVEGSLSDLMALEDALAEKVVGALQPGGSPPRERAEAMPTSNPEAHRALLKARYFWNRLTPEWLLKARSAFERAIALEPGSAASHSGLADTFTMLALYGTLPPGEAWPAARRSAEQAVRLSPDSAAAQVSLAYVRLFQGWEWQNCGEGLERAARLLPGSVDVLQWRALYFAMLGRFEEALASVARAQELDPLSLSVNAGMGFQLYLTQQHAPETLAFERTLELQPDSAIAHWALGLARDRSGEHAKAAAAHRRAAELAPETPLFRGNLARSLALAGRPREARKLLSELRKANVSPYRLATVELALNEKEAAFASLERGVATRDHWMVWLKVDPMLDSLRDDPRFPPLLRAVGLD